MSLDDLEHTFGAELLETTPLDGEFGGDLCSSEQLESFIFDIDLDSFLPPVEISRAAVQTLRKWFDQHSEWPYPNKHEKAYLSQRTGLTLTQVSTWFANARRRQKYRSARGNGGLTLQRRDSLEIINIGSSNEMLDPLERWRNSPPEAEAASLDAIMSAVAESRTRNYEPGVSPRSTPNDSRSIASSNRSRSAVSSSPSSTQSFGSHSSNASFSRFYSAEPRRRRRRGKSSTIQGLATATDREGRPFQCTFCTDTFRTKYDWTRHEKTLHLSLETYTCCPSGPAYTGHDMGSRCAFCDYPNPPESHLESHAYSACQAKPKALRTFYRKDHLMQHLRLVHGANQFPPSIDSWKSKVNRVNSRCGFCSQTFELWSERNEHLAQHFRKGALMKDWRGHHGLDPAVALAVENSMPPYQIGIEAESLQPFSATRSNQTDPMTGAAINPSAFEYFTSLLTERIRRAQVANEIITDERIQAEARKVLFGDDDPWNQTPADNPEWLRLFKLGLGTYPEDPPREEWVHLALPPREVEAKQAYRMASQ
ncbi:hypothetical protein BJX63DRAFT_421310 [Aspergillus granulosus]|uniref:Uncharacterized protein n=1 Tax=Aspergillus granulosus TaxID=176169 RepID=A0ABR4HDH4_9EURO